MKNYNPIFENLTDVSSDGDGKRLEGIVAYYLYKRSKREFIRNFPHKNDGKNPTDADIKAYCDHIISGKETEHFLASAKNVLKPWLEDMFREKVQQAEANRDACNIANLERIIKDDRGKINETIQDAIKDKQKYSAIKAVGQSLLAAFFYTILSAIFIAGWSIGNNKVVIVGPGIFDVVPCEAARAKLAMTDSVKTSQNPIIFMQK